MAESSTTRLINQVIRGDGSSWDCLYREIQPELRKIAESHLRKWSARVPAQATAVIDEAIVRLFASSMKVAAEGDGDHKVALSFEHRGAFFALMCRLMMQVLVDILRKEKRHQLPGEAGFVAELPAKSPGLTMHSKVTVLEGLIELDRYYSDKKARRLDDAAVTTSTGVPLGSSHAVIIFLHYYDELSDSEIAEKLGMKKSTVQAQRKIAEARLRQMLGKSFAD